MGDISPLAVDAENRISYVFMSPRLTIAALSEVRPFPFSPPPSLLLLRCLPFLAHAHPFIVRSYGKCVIFISPSLRFFGARQGCPSIEAKAKPNGAVFARVGKGFIEQDIE